MSEEQEHRKRYNQKLEYIAHFEKWLEQEPPMWKFIRWHRWKKQRPMLNMMPTAPQHPTCCYATKDEEAEILDKLMNDLDNLPQPPMHSCTFGNYNSKEDSHWAFVGDYKKEGEE